MPNNFYRISNEQLTKDWEELEWPMAEEICEIMHEKLPYAQELIFCSENESTDAE